MANQKFEDGAVVRLKSGGPKMTVMSYRSDTGRYCCRWYGDEPSKHIHKTEDETFYVLEGEI